MKGRKRFLFALLWLCMISPLVSAYHLQAASKCKYQMFTEEMTYKDGNKVRGIVSYEYPILKGNSKAVQKINTYFETLAKEYFKSETAKNLKEYTTSSILEGHFWDETEQYFYQTTCRVTYNKNNILSVAMCYQWYAGGVHNSGERGYTFDCKTGKLLSLTDVIEGDKNTVKKKILSAAKKFFNGQEECACLTWDEVSDIISKYEVNDFKFYLTPKKANLCFESYELGINVWTSFSVTSKYK